MANDIFAGPPPGKEDAADIFAGPPPGKEKPKSALDRLETFEKKGGIGGYLGHVVGSAAKGAAGLVKGFGDIYETGKAGHTPTPESMIPQAMGMAAIGMPGAPRAGLPAVPKPPVAKVPQIGVEEGLGQVSKQLERGRGTTSTPEGEVISDVQQTKSKAQEILDAATEHAKKQEEAQRGIVADQAKALAEAIKGGKGPVETPREAGELVGQEVRQAAQTAKTEVGQKYRQAFDKPGDFAQEVLSGVGQKVEKQIVSQTEPVLLDQTLTPAGTKAIQLLNNIEGVSLREVERTRKQLNSLYSATATNPTDRRAMKSIINAFDDHIENALADGLFSGDAKVLKEIKDARGAAASYKRTFGPQGAGDDVGLAMRKIVERKATPEEIANMVIGSRNLNAGLPVRIADRLKSTLGADSEGYNAVRQALLKQHIIDPDKLVELAQSSLGKATYSEQERAAMVSQAQGMRDLEKIIEELPSMKDAAQVRSSYERMFSGKGIGGQQQTVFQQIIEGRASPEDVSKVIFDAITSKSSGNVARMIKAIERITGEDSPAMDAIRQGAWRNVSEQATTNPQRALEAINEFLNGRGKTVAEQLYDPNELALMRRFQTALSASRTNSRLTQLVQGNLSKIMTVLGFGASHGMGGAVSGYAAGKLLEKAMARGGEKKFSKAFNPPAPQQPPGPGGPRPRLRIPIPGPRQSSGGTGDD